MLGVFTPNQVLVLHDNNLHIILYCLLYLVLDDSKMHPKKQSATVDGSLSFFCKSYIRIKWVYTRDSTRHAVAPNISTTYRLIADYFIETAVLRSLTHGHGYLACNGVDKRNVRFKSYGKFRFYGKILTSCLSLDNVHALIVFLNTYGSRQSEWIANYN